MDQVKEKTQPKGNRIKVLGRLLKLVLTTSPWMLVVSIITIILAAASAVISPALRTPSPMSWIRRRAARSSPSPSAAAPTSPRPSCSP